MPAPRLPPITNRAYQSAIRRWARDLKSDGCTGVPDIRLAACLEHDCHWRTGKTLWGDPITIQQANNRFWDSTRRLAPIKRFNYLDPVAAWRWAGVSISGLFR